MKGRELVTGNGELKCFPRPFPVPSYQFPTPFMFDHAQHANYHPTTMPHTRDEDWYAAGLHFSCTQSGNCCTGPTGFVWFNDEELTAMAKFLDLTTDEFLIKHAHQIRGHWSLNEIKRNGKYDCVFLGRDDAGCGTCSIYPVRPMQCRTWPFWPENLSSEKAYRYAAKGCPGMAKGLEGEGEFFPIEQIRIRRDATPE